MPTSKPLDIRNQIDMFPIKRGRGRPRKADALSNAERQRRFRVRQKQRDIARHSAVVDLLASTFRDLIELEARLAAFEVSGEGSGLNTLRSLARQATNRFS